MLYKAGLTKAYIVLDYEKKKKKIPTMTLKQQIHISLLLGVHMS